MILVVVLYTCSESPDDTEWGHKCSRPKGGVALQNHTYLTAEVLHSCCRAEIGQSELVLQDDELEEATWMSLEEYSAIPYQLDRPLWRKIMECCVAYAEGTYKGMQGITLCDDPKLSPRKDSHLLLVGENTMVAPSSAESQGECMHPLIFNL